jgi:hypothetical protein
MIFTRLFLCVIFLTLPFVIQSVEQPCQKKTVHFEKIYVTPQNIYICEEGIFILSENAIFKTSAIYQDQNGIYFDQGEPPCKGSEWECRVCHWCNPFTYFFCEICDNSRFKK